MNFTQVSAGMMQVLSKYDVGINCELYLKITVVEIHSILYRIQGLLICS